MYISNTVDGRKYEGACIRGLVSGGRAYMRNNSFVNRLIGLFISRGAKSLFLKAPKGTYSFNSL